MGATVDLEGAADQVARLRAEVDELRIARDTFRAQALTAWRDVARLERELVSLRQASEEAHPNMGAR